ncbi:SDR family oxidoreductase [Bacillus sp. CGMCC 1.16607]|uniref:SDR family oxidoreductase n=1 Tax=Bacillus sp. CGMCC 1.16607 TaxID=3351842 RepID=UPI00364199F8
MANTYFFTGFPGFLATSLIKKIIHDQYEIDHIYLLVLPNQAQKALEEIGKIVKEEGISVEMFTVIKGDITKPHLDIQPGLNESLHNKATHIFHLAAIYDLAVPKDIAYKVNVMGTKNVNEWVLNCQKIKRYIYFSTSYVAGTREGRILESQLEMNQSFKNHYERTKCEAEVLVQSLKDKVPTTIIRPGIVVGNSRTGETIKFDGPYFILNFFDRLKFLPILPYLGQGRAKGNFVPVDYIFNATVYLGHAEVGIGKTYQLTDPKPYSAKEVYRMLMKEYLGKEPIGMIPLSFAKWFLSFSVFRKWVKVEKEALDYFTCLAEYDCTQTEHDLRGSGITCPDFKEIIPPMVDYYRKHKNDKEKHLTIQ